MEMDVELTGFDTLASIMSSLPVLVAERVQGDGLFAAAEVVRDQAKANVPVKTGALQRSIRVRRRSQRVETTTGRKSVPGAAAQVVAGGRGAAHALLVELGTVRAAPHPYLAPALFETQGRLLAEARAAMTRAFVRLGRDLAAGKASRTIARLAAES